MVTIYTTTTCPKCKILKQRMDSKGIKYEEVNDIETLSKKGIFSVPFIEVNNNLMDFNKSLNWIKEQ